MFYLERNEDRVEYSGVGQCAIAFQMQLLNAATSNANITTASACGIVLFVSYCVNRFGT